MKRLLIGNAWVDNVTMPEAIAEVDRIILRGRPATVVTPNVDHVVRMTQDTAFAQIVATADLVLPDGLPLVWASHLLSFVLGQPSLKQRVAGSDLFVRLCQHAATVGHRVFFFGGAPGAAEGARAVLTERFPDLRVVGTHCPPMGFEQDSKLNQQCIRQIRQARPHILFVGLGSPKQELWIAQHKHRYEVPVSIGVGISFAFACGQVRRAPVWVQRAGFEWLHRMTQEPRRLWRRYLLRCPRFVPLIAAQILGARATRRNEYPGIRPRTSMSSTARNRDRS
ncbi:MAG TPA: WecB/TagA/CpsF family glycosyltransferase [Phycisphaerae bacterium]|nr:WecB/TagA/CpsF family glycosyltransferase [Phycisphaerae bacterium]